MLFAHFFSLLGIIVPCFAEIAYGLQKNIYIYK